MLNLWQQLFKSRSEYELCWVDFGDKLHNIFEFFDIFIWFDERLKGIYYISLMINLYDSKLDRNIFGSIQSCGFKIYSNISILRM